MRRVGNKKGFTLVELSLSIAFIAILSITVALIINNAVSTYRRGIVLNQINTMGMDLVDDIRTAIQNSPAKSVKSECEIVYSDANSRKNCQDDNATRFVLVKGFASVDGVGDNVPVYGAFCTGAYSYIWNSGYFDMRDGLINSKIEKAQVVYRIGGGSDLTIKDFRLVKVKDRGRSVCLSAVGKDSYTDNISNEFKVDGLSESPEILLSGDSSQSLALYDLSVAPPATNDLGTDSYYSVSFILGTVQGGINVMSSGNFCKTPEDYDSNFDYCAINKFNFAAQAVGG